MGFWETGEVIEAGYTSSAKEYRKYEDDAVYQTAEKVLEDLEAGKLQPRLTAYCFISYGVPVLNIEMVHPYKSIWKKEREILYPILEEKWGTPLQFYFSEIPVDPNTGEWDSSVIPITKFATEEKVKAVADAAIKEFIEEHKGEPGNEIFEGSPIFGWLNGSVYQDDDYYGDGHHRLRIHTKTDKVVGYGEYNNRNIYISHIGNDFFLNVEDEYPKKWEEVIDFVNKYQDVKNPDKLKEMVLAVPDRFSTRPGSAGLGAIERWLKRNVDKIVQNKRGFYNLRFWHYSYSLRYKKGGIPVLYKYDFKTKVEKEMEFDIRYYFALKNAEVLKDIVELDDY